MMGSKQLFGPWTYGNTLQESLDKQRLRAFVPSEQLLNYAYFKPCNQVCILGEGPSVGSLPDEILYGNTNRFGVGYLPFSNLHFNIMLHEPIACTHLYNDFKNSKPDRNAMLNHRNGAAMDGMLPLAMLANKPDIVILNPEFPRDANGYFSIYDQDMHVLPLYFINESSRYVALTQIKQYLQSNSHYNTVLNYRCSIIRMVSLAFLLRYPTIIFSGIDPSMPDYWYTNAHATSRLCNKDLHHVSQFIRIASQLRHFRKEWTCFVSPQNQENGGYCNQSNFDIFDFTVAFFLVIKSLLRKHEESGYRPHLIYYGNDSHVLQIISFMKLDRQIEVRAIA
jgi:hypothetical protein